MQIAHSVNAYLAVQLKLAQFLSLRFSGPKPVAIDQTERLAFSPLGWSPKVKAASYLMGAVNFWLEELLLPIKGRGMITALRLLSLP